MLGTINAEQFEREIMRQNPAAPPVPNDNDQRDEFVWVDHPGMQRAAAAAAAAAAGGDADADDVDLGDSDGDELEDVHEQDQGEDGEGSGAENDDGAGGAGAARGDEPVARVAGRKVSGKRARRGFEERRERREERRLALEALGPDEWD